MSKVKFISAKYLKDNSSIEGNVDDDILNPYILKAQNYIHKMLGTSLYNKLKNDVISNSITGIYKTILDDYVQPCLVEYSAYEALPFIYLKFTNKSITKRSSEFGSSADIGEVKWLRSIILDVAEFTSQRLIDYLKANITSIPEYQNPGSSIDTIRPNNSSYFNGVYLGNGGKDRCDFGVDD